METTKTTLKLAKPKKEYGLEAYMYNMSMILQFLAKEIKGGLEQVIKPNDGNIDYFILNDGKAKIAVIIKLYSSNFISQELLGDAITRIISHLELARKQGDKSVTECHTVLVMNNISELATKELWDQYVFQKGFSDNRKYPLDEYAIRFLGSESISTLISQLSENPRLNKLSTELNKVWMNAIPAEPFYFKDRKLVLNMDMVLQKFDIQTQANSKPLKKRKSAVAA